MRFSERELTVISNALRVAAERFRESAQALRAEPHHERLAQQFEQQADEALALYERLAETEGVAC